MKEIKDKEREIQQKNLRRRYNKYIREQFFYFPSHTSFLIASQN